MTPIPGRNGHEKAARATKLVALLTAFDKLMRAKPADPPPSALRSRLGSSATRAYPTRRSQP